MSTDTTLGADANAVTVLHKRLGSAIRSNQELGVTGPLRAFALVDAPRLVAIAARGVAARVQFAGLAIRAAAVRDLHAPEDRGGGLLLCRTCSTWLFVLWPCPTMQALDGLEAP